MSEESNSSTKAVGFLAVALVAGFALGELGTIGITGQAIGDEGPPLVWSYDRNYVQHCVERKNLPVNQCILEAACQNINSDFLGKVFKTEVQKGLKLTAKGEPFYWDDVADKGNKTAILLLNNLCADFHYWLPSKDLIDLPNGVKEPTVSPANYEDVNRVVEAYDDYPQGVVENDFEVSTPTAPSNDDLNNEVEAYDDYPQGVVESDFTFTETEMFPHVIDFNVSSANEADPKNKLDKNLVNRKHMPICRGKRCMESKYWAKGTLITQESCAEIFGKAVKFYGTKKFVTIMAQQNCHWVPDNE